MPRLGSRVRISFPAPIKIFVCYFFRLCGRVVMQRPAKPCTPVQFRPQPPINLFHAQVAKQVDARDLKSLGGYPMPVRFRPWAPYTQVQRVRNTILWLKLHLQCQSPETAILQDEHAMLLPMSWRVLCPFALRHCGLYFTDHSR